MPLSEFPPPGANAPLLLRGPVADIETLLSSPRSSATPAGCIVICHPHPLMGGAMSNKVVYTLAAAALDCGLHALRFNFRGVGKSGGVHDQGVGETGDTLFLAQWAREQLPGAQIALAGFSFGAHVSLRAAAQVRPRLLVSIAPPFGKYASGAPDQGPGCPWLAVHGRDDEVVSYDETMAALQRYVPPPEIVSMDGVGHFFHGRLTEVRGIVVPFIKKHW
jgi:alpha/beta superfamily hydrolase